MTPKKKQEFEYALVKKVNPSYDSRTDPPGKRTEWVKRETPIDPKYILTVDLATPQGRSQRDLLKRLNNYNGQTVRTEMRRVLEQISMPIDIPAKQSFFGSLGAVVTQAALAADQLIAPAHYTYRLAVEIIDFKQSTTKIIAQNVDAYNNMSLDDNNNSTLADRFNRSRREVANTFSNGNQVESIGFISVKFKNGVGGELQINYTRSGDLSNISGDVTRYNLWYASDYPLNAPFNSYPELRKVSNFWTKFNGKPKDRLEIYEKALEQGGFNATISHLDRLFQIVDSVNVEGGSEQSPVNIVSLLRQDQTFESKFYQGSNGNITIIEWLENCGMPTGEKVARVYRGFDIGGESTSA